MGAEIQLTQGYVALVSEEDYERVAARKWYASKHTNYVYALTRSRAEDKCHTSKITMHRFILDVIGAPHTTHVDHINRNTLDNRRENLRICTQAENHANSGSRKRPGRTSAYKGVAWHKGDKTWRAGIGINRKQFDLGRFECEEEAARAYDKAALEAWGEFAYLNFPESNVTTSA